MDNTKPTILFAREVPWGAHFSLSTLRLAEECAKEGWNVIWVMPPLMPWHRMQAERFGRHAAHRARGLFPRPNVFTYASRALVPFSRRWPLDAPWLATAQWLLAWERLPTVLRAHKVPKPDALVLSGFATGGVQALFPNTFTIYHVTDDYSDYPSAPSTVREIERRTYTRGDHVVVTTESLRHLVVADIGVPERRVTVIGHGVAVDEYERILPDPLPGVPHPRVIYVGNPAKLDLQIVDALLSSGVRPQLQLIVAGPRALPLTERARRAPNLHCLGVVPPEQVPQHLMHADLGLIAFSEDLGSVLKHINPMKAYEYAAAGLPILAKPLPVFQEVGLPFSSIGSEGVDSVVDAALRSRAEVGAKLRAFATVRSWRARFFQLVSLLPSRFELPMSGA